MSNLKSRLKAWVDAAIISDQQAMQIETFENLQHPSKLMLKTSILGLVVFALGLSGLLAKHWNEITDLTKLSVDGVGFFILSCVLIKRFNKLSSTIKESLILFYIFYILASIGLVVQVFQIQVQLYEVAFFWSFVTLPVIVYSRSVINIYLWSGVLIVACLLQNIVLDAFFVFFSLPFIFAICLGLINKFKINKAWSRACCLHLFVFGLSGLIIMELPLIASEIAWQKVIIISCIFSMFFVGLMHFDDAADKLYKNINIAIILLYLLMFGLSSWGVNSSLLILFGISILWLVAVQVSRLGYDKTFKLLSLIISYKFLMLFFVLVEDRAQPEVVFVFLGALIMLMVKLWVKFNKKLNAWIKALV